MLHYQNQFQLLQVPRPVHVVQLQARGRRPHHLHALLRRVHPEDVSQALLLLRQSEQVLADGGDALLADGQRGFGKGVAAQEQREVVVEVANNLGVVAASFPVRKPDCEDRGLHNEMSAV